MSGVEEIDKFQKIFQDPPAEYRGIPFWAWNCRLNEGQLAEQVGIFKEMGFGGFYMHVRTGMDTPYLGREFMEHIKKSVEEAKCQGLFPWIYDEDRWASGAAGGLVTKEKKFRQKYLLFTSYSYEEKGPSKPGRGFLAPIERACNGRLLGRYDVRLDENGFLKAYVLLKEGEKARYEEWFAYLETARDNPWYNGQTYLDTLWQSATEKFLQITHESYEKAVGENFQKVIPGVFTDEPQFVRKQTLPFPESKTDVVLPWTEDIEESFQNCYGYSLLERLPELFWEQGKNRPSQARYHYHDHVTERFCKGFFAPYAKWCHIHHLKLTGHLMEEPTLASQCAAVGEAMRAYPYLDIPGVDMLRKDMEFTTVKQAQSISRQCGREGVMSELYGVTGWDFDFRDYKFYGDWQAAMGVTLRVPHLSWASMEGEAKRDFPASIFYQSPWYKEFPYIEEHFARIRTAMTRGKPKVRIGVIHPIESYWLAFGPARQTAEFRQQLDENFQNLTNWLTLGGIDFDFICESLLPGQCKQGTFPFKVGEMKYEAVLIPGCTTLRKTTIERLENFLEKGGKVFFIGDKPIWMDGCLSDRPKKLYEKASSLPFEKNKILQELNAYRDVKIFDERGYRPEHFLYQLREEKDRKWLFLARGERPYHKDICSLEKIQIGICGIGYVVLWDTLTGKKIHVNSRIEKGWTWFFLDFYDYDSALLSLEKEKMEDCETPSDNFKDKTEIKIPEMVMIQREEPNVLLLDKAEYALDEEEYHEKMEILRADNSCRERLGWLWRGMAIPQPWTLEKEVYCHKIRLRFHVESDVEEETVFLGLERAAEKQIFWNGEEVIPKIIGWYTDKAIQTVSLTGLRKGHNCLEVIQPFGRDTNTEWMYLLGEFNVVLKGENSLLTQWDPKVGFDTLTIQGLPFYGGAVVYEIPFETTKENISIRIPHYRAGLLRVWVDEDASVPVVLPPYERSFEKIRPGKHILKVKAYISRNNSFGPVHLADEKDEWFGPSAWRTQGDRWTESYRLSEQGLLSKVEITEY